MICFIISLHCEKVDDYFLSTEKNDSPFQRVVYDGGFISFQALKVAFQVEPVRLM